MSSEKGLPTWQQPEPVAAWSKRAAVAKAFLLGSLAFAALLLRSPDGVDWILRSMRSHHHDGIAWAACPDISTMQCAYLTVPMDYANPRPNETVSLALRKVPASAPIKDRKGPLLSNPGGPGGSGTSFVVRGGPMISTILDGRYDIISWDPRSVNLTTPALNCFDNMGDANRFARDVQHVGLPLEARGVHGNDSVAELNTLTKIDTFGKALADACYEQGNKLLQRSTSTAFVVRDMVSILDALGETHLQYWGFSYGTILGATFAAMFPEKVGRVVLDGVSDSVSYTNDLIEWGKSGMHDTSKTYEGFFSSCAAAGPDRCAFAKHGQDAKALAKRVEEIEKALLKSPLAVSKSKVGPGIVTVSDLRQGIFQMLYRPASWQDFAKSLAATEAGDGQLMYEFVNGANDALDRHTPKTPFHRPLSGTIADTFAIMCSDTDKSVFKNWTLADLQKYYQKLGSISPTGEIWANWMTHCAQWRSDASEAYRGPWSREQGLRKTAFPVLFASNTADPVTPLMAAESMSRGFGNDSASLIIQRAYGHCTSSHPSLKASKAIRDYFIKGVVPEYGATYDADPGFLFPESKAAMEAEFETMSDEDKKLKKALHGLADIMHEYSMRPSRAF